MTITAERIDHAIQRLDGEGGDAAKIARFLERRAEMGPQCPAHPTELPSLLLGMREDGFDLVCASCIPAAARAAVTLVGHE